MLISEILLTSRSLFKISGYTIYESKDPRGGGSAILLKSRIKHYSLDNVCHDFLQAKNICFEDVGTNDAFPDFRPLRSYTKIFLNLLGPVS